MRILLTNFHNGWGGQPYQALLLSLALRKRGHEITVASPPDSELATRAASAGVNVFTGCSFPRGFRPFGIWKDVSSLREFVEKNEIDLVHAHGSQDNWLTLAARKLGKRKFALVRTKHNSYPVRPHWFNRRLFAREIDRTIAVAEIIRQDILSSSGSAQERIVTLHAGLPDDFGNDVPVDAALSVRAEFGIRPEAPLIGLVGRLAPDKGQEVLMRALVSAYKSLPEAHVLLVGTGGDYDRLLKLRAQLGLDDCVHFTLFREDIARLTAACSVAVLAATACDASSTVLKEAMKLRVPVIGSNVGGTREILADGTCGALIQPGQHVALAKAIVDIVHALGSKEMETRLNLAENRVKELYVMSAVAEKTEAIYRQALENR
jgi:glycosyltransferase involved in cell wall biosynthesis